MVAKTSLTAKNLEALGPERLAALLVEIGTGNAAVKRRLRLELALAQNPGNVSKEVRKAPERRTAWRKVRKQGFGWPSATMRRPR